MDVSVEEVIAELQRICPDKVQIAVLTITNRNQAERIKSLETEVKALEDSVLP